MSLLPLPGVKVYYFPNFISESDKLFKELVKNLDLDFKKNGRSSCLYGNGSIDSTDSTLNSNPQLMRLRDQIQDFVSGLDSSFKNSLYDKCFCNYYKNGRIIFNAHADREERNKQTPIASVSLGATRLFYFRSMRDKSFKHQFKLESGSLLVISSECQDLYLHGLPADAEVKEPRLNLTFRGSI